MEKNGRWIWQERENCGGKVARVGDVPSDEGRRGLEKKWPRTHVVALAKEAVRSSVEARVTE